MSADGSFGIQGRAEVKDTRVTTPFSNTLPRNNIPDLAPMSPDVIESMVKITDWGVAKNSVHDDHYEVVARYDENDECSSDFSSRESVKHGKKDMGDRCPRERSSLCHG